MNGVNQIICGPALEVSKTIPDESINCSISSPPYWALRDYGVDGQLGLEKTFEKYIDKLCAIYDEVKRVLRKDGTCWVNLGDTYNAGRSGGWAGGKHGMSKPENAPNQSGVNARNIPTKSLCLIPQRFAIEMVNRGWILRNTIIWHKPNPMPSSAKDRFTVDFEYVYFFVKSKKYFFEPIYEQTGNEASWEEYLQADGHKSPSGNLNDGINAGFGSKKDSFTHPLGRNKRTVWEIPTQAYKFAHFATFPEKLVEPMILSGCPKEVCPKCGQGRRKVYDREVVHNRPNSRPDANVRPDNYERIPSDWKPKETKVLGYTDCGCGEKFRPGVVFDPFVGRARLARSLPKTDETGSVSSLNRSISRWPNAA